MLQMKDGMMVGVQQYTQKFTLIFLKSDKVHAQLFLYLTGWLHLQVLSPTSYMNCLAVIKIRILFV